jgi:UDP-2-acetamido-2,6-beta-L-arabino-hexul-4-ose reductase
MRVVITGADGFIGKNLRAALMERAGTEVLPITRDSTPRALVQAIAQADAVVHLAGVNRPQSNHEFAVGNADFTLTVCNAVRSAARPVPLLLSSSTQAKRDNLYGASKRAAENHVFSLATDAGSPVAVYSLPNVFGKWARPNYNSAIATFCHNAVHGLPLVIHDPAAVVRLVYVDDVIADFLRRLDGDWPADGRAEVAPVYEATVGELADTIQTFRSSRQSLMTAPVGTGLTRALYATYVSYLPPGQFTYDLPKHGDARGVFVEMLKTPDCGQFSFFTAHPGVTRGGHYHHTKTEKFLVIKGMARFGFRHILSGETFELHTSGDQPTVVESVPGWAHDITNVGDTEMFVMLWANEVFDRARPDTYAHKV